MSGTFHDDVGPGSARGDGSLFAGVAALCETAVLLSEVDGAAAAMLSTSASRELMHATDGLAHQLDELEFTLGVGPCLDAYRQGEPQSYPGLHTAVARLRWPTYCDGAIELGVAAVFAYPIPAAPGPLGVLELYRRTPGALPARQDQMAAMCATTIGATLQANWTIYLDGVDDVEEAVNEAPLQLNPSAVTGISYSRSGVYVASGVVAVQLGVSVEQGLDLLRAHAYARGRTIAAVAADVTDRRLFLRNFLDEGGGC